MKNDGEEKKEHPPAPPERETPAAQAEAEASARKDKKKKESEQLKEQLAAKHEQLLRVAAEYDNYRKRVARELEEGRKFACGQMAGELLPILDNMERALVVMEEQTDVAALRKGIEYTHGQLKEVMARFGVRRIECRGQKFDPRFHEAVLHEESTSHHPGQIVQEVQPGYLLHDRVIRASKVTVAKAKAEEKKE